MPALASPATASPATIATVIGRNTGSTSASAAAGKSWPLLTTADRNAPPRPGGGARPVTASSTATSAGSAHSSAQHSQTRRRRSSRPSSTPVTTGLASPRSASDPVGSVSGELQHHLLQASAARATSSVTRTPARDEPGVQRRRVVVAHDERGRRSGRRPARRSSATAAAGSGRAHAAPARSARAARSRSSLEHQPSRVHHADPVAQRVDLGEQVAGQHDGRAGLVQRGEQRRGSRRCRAGPGRSSARRAAAAPGRAAARRRCRAAGACPASTPAPGGGRSRRGRPARAPRRPAAAGPARRPGPAASMQAQVRAPGQVRPRRRALDQRADAGQHPRGAPRHRLAEQLDLARRSRARARAASARASSCPSRSGRAGRTGCRRGSAGRRRRRR